MESLARFVQMEVIEAVTQWQNRNYADESDCWHDSLLICRKPDKGIWWNKKSNLNRWLQHRTATIGMR
jgi:hypothetical protein